MPPAFSTYLQVIPFYSSLTTAKCLLNRNWNLLASTNLPPRKWRIPTLRPLDAEAVVIGDCTCTLPDFVFDKIQARWTYFRCRFGPYSAPCHTGGPCEYFFLILSAILTFHTCFSAVSRTRTLNCSTVVRNLTKNLDCTTKISHAHLVLNRWQEKSKGVVAMFLREKLSGGKSRSGLMHAETVG